MSQLWSKNILVRQCTAIFFYFSKRTLQELQPADITAISIYRAFLRDNDDSAIRSSTQSSSIRLPSHYRLFANHCIIGRLAFKKYLLRSFSAIARCDDAFSDSFE